MNFNILLLSTFLFAGAVVAERFNYEGYKLVDLFPKNKEQFELIQQLENNEDFDLWGLKPEAGKVALSPLVFPKYEVIFRLFNIQYKVVHDNLQQRIDDELATMMKRDVSDNRIVGQFARYSEIQNWLENPNGNLPLPAGLRTRTYIPGTSVQGRNLKVIVLSTASSSRKIWIDCGIHAREWISPASCIYMIDALIREYGSDATTTSLLNYFEIHVLPLVNPDGYEFSHTNTRLWRKNRNTFPGTTCIGTDLNRNYAYQWMTGGSSNSPCVDTYAGPSAGSEPETKAVVAAINAALGTWDAFITIHTYGKWIFTTWGYTTALPSDFAEQNDKARITRDAIHTVTDTNNWTHGSSAQILYIASGGSEDWAKGVANIPYAYCWELRPHSSNDRDSTFGFQLPADRIPAAGREAFVGLKAFLNAIKK